MDIFYSGLNAVPDAVLKYTKWDAKGVKEVQQYEADLLERARLLKQEARRTQALPENLHLLEEGRFQLYPGGASFKSFPPPPKNPSQSVESKLIEGKAPQERAKLRSHDTRPE